MLQNPIPDHIRERYTQQVKSLPPQVQPEIRHRKQQALEILRELTEVDYFTPQEFLALLRGARSRAQDHSKLAAFLNDTHFFLEDGAQAARAILALDDLQMAEQTLDAYHRRKEQSPLTVATTVEVGAMNEVARQKYIASYFKRREEEAYRILDEKLPPAAQKCLDRLEKRKNDQFPFSQINLMPADIAALRAKDELEQKQAAAREFINQRRICTLRKGTDRDIHTKVVASR